MTDTLNAGGFDDAKSVTRFTESVTGAGPLPADLLAALNVAAFTASSAGGAVELARTCFPPAPVPPADERPTSVAARVRAERRRRPTPSQAGPVDDLHKLILLHLAAIQREFPHHGRVTAVTNELTAVSEPDGRFGAANAHRAAVGFGIRVHMIAGQVGDPEGFARCVGDPGARTDPEKIAANVAAVAAALAERTDWPDVHALTVQCEVEACRAAAARARRAGGPDALGG